jgi:hypothetical protein
MATTVTKSDIISAITLYIASNDEGRTNCPVNYLIDEKFGKQHKKLILKLVADLKKAGAIVGKRGRTGGLCFPESATIEAKSVETEDSENDESDDTDVRASDEDTIEQDGMEIEPIPF